MKDLFLVPRTCTWINKKTGESKISPLESYRNQYAYVLLGDSGLGKTTAFKEEAEASDGKYTTARDFINLDLKDEDLKKTLFIDALDEMRMIGDPRASLDQIRNRLQNHTAPFRLSCREADWLGNSDYNALKILVNKEILILHLDPLTDENVKDILNHRKDVLDPVKFISEAHRHNLKELLYNPQILNLLIEAVGEKSEWPKSRKQVYDIACRNLLLEKNVEHRHANRKRYEIDKLLDAAGFLCAIQLFRGISGYALDNDSVDLGHVNLNELAPTDYDLTLLECVLKKNVFRSGPKEQQRIPIHRSVSEYLAARYLAMLIDKPVEPLPFERVLALMPDGSGIIASDLRGLSAWLAVHCNSDSQRKILIEQDPLGVVVYGDVRNFSVVEKELILNAFKNKIYDDLNNDRTLFDSLSFGALGTQDMLPKLKEILSLSSPEKGSQQLLRVALSALAYSEPNLDLANDIEKLIRNPNYFSSIRSQAVQVLARNSKNNEVLFKIAEDIRLRVIEDRDDEVLGKILCNLYPGVISSSQIFNYLHPLSFPYLFNSYFQFWHYGLFSTRAEDLPNLVDQLVKKLPELRDFSSENQLETWIGKLLVKGLELHGEILDDKRLYDWLGLGVDGHENQFLERKHASSVSQWLENHPDRYKAMIKQSASLCNPQEKFELWDWRFNMRSQRACPPPDIEYWYLENSKIELKINEKLAQYYLWCSIFSIIRMGEGRLTSEKEKFLENQLENYPELLSYLEKIIPDVHLFCKRHENILEMKENKKIDRKKRRSDRAKPFRENILSIRDGSAPPWIMFELAEVYNGKRSYDVYGDTPEDRLRDFLDDDQELVKVTQEAFRYTLNRSDLPTVSEIIKLYSEEKYPLIRPACLIGMDRLYEDNPSALLKLSNSLLSKMLAFYFTADCGEKDPLWVTDLINERPLLIKEVLLKYALAMIRKKKEYISSLFRLVDNKEYSNIASAILPSLLNALPLRISKKIFENVFRPLLKGAVNKLDKKELLSIVDKKLNSSSLDKAQRVYWLACGFVVKPPVYISQLRDYIKNSQTRKRDLGYFLQIWVNDFPNIDLDEEALSFLIEILAPLCSPESPLGPHFVTPEIRISDLVHTLIIKLQNKPDKKLDLLEYLVSLESLVSWREFLDKALRLKKSMLSRSSFKCLSVSEICSTLANNVPSNVADLFALTASGLKRLKKEIRDNNTNDYRQYWSFDENNKKLIRSKPENDCRDALLSDLKIYLSKWGIDCQPEGSYADNKQSDIRVSFHGVNVPIEIKKDEHKDLWSSIHNQLIKKYVRDPGTDGFGIYVVFWFCKESIRSPDTREKINSPEKLEEKLRNTLSAEERQRIQICVIDVSLP